MSGHAHDHGSATEAELAQRLRAGGYRLTAPRQAILRAVEELGHATPDEVLAHARAHSARINASTVYRSLEVLESLGLVRHAHLSDRAPTYHSTSASVHFHAVCRGCGDVKSIEPALADSLVTALRTDHDFNPDLGHLTVFGKCGACADPT